MATGCFWSRWSRVGVFTKRRAIEGHEAFNGKIEGCAGLRSRGARGDGRNKLGPFGSSKVWGLVWVGGRGPSAGASAKEKKRRCHRSRLQGGGEHGKNHLMS